MSVLVPLSLVLLALIDAAFAGFRAATGRNARIRKRAYYLRSAARGLALGALGLGLIGLLCAAILLPDNDSGARYAELARAGERMLLLLVPFAALVTAAMLAWWLLPMRPSAFVILLGLGPFTLLRPLVVLAASVQAALGATDWLLWTVALGSAAVVLAVEPLAHQRWYRWPT